MKFSDNQSFIIIHDKEEVAVKIHDSKFNEDTNFFINKEQWEEIKPKIDNAFKEMSRD